MLCSHHLCCVCVSLCVPVYVYLCVSVCVSVTLLDNSSLSVAACTALAEIGRRNALPLHDRAQLTTDTLTTDQLTADTLTADQSDQLTADTLTADQSDQLTTAALVENLLNKVKSTSENAKVY